MIFHRFLKYLKILKKGFDRFIIEHMQKMIICKDNAFEWLLTPASNKLRKHLIIDNEVTDNIRQFLK